jgi:DNA-binding response OmpR family regulator
MSATPAVAKGLSIALLEDDLVLRDRILVPQLADYGLPVEPLGTAAELYQRLEQTRFDIVVLDVGLPDEDGFAVIQRLRVIQPEMGIILLTGRSDTTNRVRGLTEGADAYLAKPVEIEVLVATLQSVARRVPQAVALTNVKAAGWHMDPRGWQLIDPCGASILLTKSERKFVACLLGHPGDVVTRETLVEALTKDVYDFDLHRLDNLLHRLRRKVKSTTDVPLPITSVHGEGYVWVSA